MVCCCGSYGIPKKIKRGGPWDPHQLVAGRELTAITASFSRGVRVGPTHASRGTRTVKLGTVSTYVAI